MIEMIPSIVLMHGRNARWLGPDSSIGRYDA